MTPPNVNIDVLRTLHRIHRQLSDLRGRLERGPKQVRATKSNVEYCQKQLDESQDAYKAARVASDAKQVQLKAGEDKIQELKLKLNTANSNREYQALKDQIAAQEMTNSVLTDEILEGMDKIDTLQQKIAKAEADLAKAHKKDEEIRGKVEKQEPLIRGDLERLQAELKQCEASMPAEVKEPYHRVVRHRGEDAMAAVDNQHCTGCNQQVQLNVCAEMLLGRPMFCKSCGRMLYLPEDQSLTTAEDSE